MKQRRLRAITLQGGEIAIVILVKIGNLIVAKIISYFGCTSIIFADSMLIVLA